MSDDVAAPAKAGANLIPISQAAALLMVTERWIRDLQKKGYVPKADRGMVSLVGAVQGYIKWLKDEERRTSKSAAASRVQDARAREIEIRIAKEEGRLVELEEAESVFAEIIGAYRSELSGIPAALTRDLDFRAKIEKLHNDAIDRCRRRFAEACEALRAGREYSLGDEASNTG